MGDSRAHESGRKRRGEIPTEDFVLIPGLSGRSARTSCKALPRETGRGDSLVVKRMAGRAGPFSVPATGEARRAGTAPGCQRGLCRSPDRTQEDCSQTARPLAARRGEDTHWTCDDWASATQPRCRLRSRLAFTRSRAKLSPFGCSGREAASDSLRLSTPPRSVPLTPHPPTHPADTSALQSAWPALGL